MRVHILVNTQETLIVLVLGITQEKGTKYFHEPEIVHMDVQVQENLPVTLKEPVDQTMRVIM